MVVGNELPNVESPPSYDVDNDDHEAASYGRSHLTQEETEGADRRDTTDGNA